MYSASLVASKALRILKFIGTNLLLTSGIMFLLCPRCMRYWESFWSNIDSFLFTFLMCILLGEGIGYLVDQLDKRISWIETPLKRLIISLVVLIGYSFCVSLISVIIFGLFIWKRLTFANFDWGFVLQSTTFPVYISLGITAFLTSRSFLFSWRQAAIDTERLKRENLQSQYDTLKNQVNPHFLFNSFNVLTDLIYMNQDQAAEFVQQLSKVFRYVLESNEKELVPLSTEIEFLKSYVFLLTIRFGENLKVILPEKVGQENQIIPLCLQMLVENAIKHNIVSSDDPLTIEVGFNKDWIFVCNNLQRKNFVEHSTQIGLANIQARYQYLSGKPITIEETNQHFKVTIPLLAVSA